METQTIPYVSKKSKDQKQIRSTKLVFPSYSELQEKITLNQKQKYGKKIDNLDNQIIRIKNRMNFQNEHRKMIEKMLELQKNKKNFYIWDKQEEGNQIKENANREYHEILLQQVLGLEWQNKNTLSKNKAKGRYKNVESLNQYLEDDDCAETSNNKNDNHFQVYLKFRRKALLRQLQKDEDNKTIIKQDQKEEQQFFKNLFQFPISYNQNTKEKIINPKIKNLAKNKQKLLNSPKDVFSRCDKENQMIAQNREKLNDLYKPFIDGLAHTNIVKLRIMNNEDIGCKNTKKGKVN